MHLGGELFLLIFRLGVLTAPITPVLHFSLMKNEAKNQAEKKAALPLLVFLTPYALRLLRAKKQFTPAHARLFCTANALVFRLEAAPL